MTGLHVIVVDDHPLMLEALTQIISSAPDLLVVKTCLTCAEALAAVRSYRPEILLLDVQLPDVSGADMIPTFIAANPETRIVVFTATLDRLSMINALHAGAKAVLLKTSP